MLVNTWNQNQIKSVCIYIYPSIYIYTYFYVYFFSVFIQCLYWVFPCQLSNSDLKKKPHNDQFIYICIRATWAFKVICGSLASLKNKWGKCCPGKPQDTNPKSKNTVNYVQCCVVLMYTLETRCSLSLSAFSSYFCGFFFVVWLK